MQEIKKQILSRTNIKSLIGESCSLQQRGNISIGLCPFHEENTPSFYVYDDHYHCYGCGEHGDAISYIRKQQGLSFMDSLRILADKAGIPLDPNQDEEKYKDERKRKNREVQTLLAAKEFFTSQLKDPFYGKFARNHLESRKISQDLIDELGLGYAPAFSDSLTKHMNKIGFRSEELSACSLANGSRGRIFDFFQNRLIFPIRDDQGRVIAFTGRSLGTELPKYKNSRFEKGSFLFGFDRARNYIRQKARVLLVEGHFDVLQMWNHGFGETVACQGTTLTQEHLRKINHVTKQIILVFDGDEAGRRAAMKVLDHAFEFPELHFKYAELPPKEDPDSLLRKSGNKVMEDLLEKAEDLLDFAIKEKLSTAPKTGVAQLVSQTLIPWVDQIQDPIRRSFLIQRISQKTGIAADLLDTGRKSSIKTAPVEKPVVKKEENFVLEGLEKEFLGHLYCAQPDLLVPEVNELLTYELEFSNVWLEFIRELQNCLKEGASPKDKDTNYWQASDRPEIASFLDEIQNKKKAFEALPGLNPFSRIHLEIKRKKLRSNLESLKLQLVAYKTQNDATSTPWITLTQALVKTTHELQNLESHIRKGGV